MLIQRHLLEKELLSAAQNLPVEPAVYGKATKSAALTLLGRFYLDTKQWQKAADVNKQVIDLGYHSLFPNVEGVFAVENEGNREMIFVFGSLATAPIQALAWNYTPHAYPVGYQTSQVNYGAQFQLFGDGLLIPLTQMIRGLMNMIPQMESMDGF